MSKFYINIKQNFYFCKNKIVDFIEKWPFYLNKIKKFCIYIISFFKTQYKNLIDLKNMKFSLYPHEILSNAKIVLNCCIALIAFTIILIVIIYFSFFLDILKFLLKLIIFIIWKIPKFLVIKIKKIIISLFSLMKWLIKNRKKVENINNNEIKNLNRKLELQNRIIEQLLKKKENEKIIKRPKINKKTNLKEVKK